MTAFFVCGVRADSLDSENAKRKNSCTSVHVWGATKELDRMPVLLFFPLSVCTCGGVGGRLCGTEKTKIEETEETVEKKK